MSELVAFARNTHKRKVHSYQYGAVLACGKVMRGHLWEIAGVSEYEVNCPKCLKAMERSE